jgi:2-keto-4-pentenoate hydratase
MDIEHAADTLWAGIRRGEHMPADWFGRLDAAQGYAVNLAILRRRIADGDAHLGWKVGLTSDAMRAQWSIPEPCFGVLLRSGTAPRACASPSTR